MAMTRLAFAGLLAWTSTASGPIKSPKEPFHEKEAGPGGVANSNEPDPFYTHFHAQPLKNWLNDPNGPMFFNGRYHLFFQYNPDGPRPGAMHWYHMVSKDLLHWDHLPVALAPDQKYDCGGIFSGSATVFHNASTGKDVPVLTYSVACGKAIVHALPADAADVNLTRWTKPSYDPVINVPPSVKGGFRDPTTAWQGKDKTWRLLVGCGNGEGTCQFKSTDFISWEYVGAFHSHGGGMWECPDFYKLAGTDKYVLKASANGDWWAVGTYTEVADDSKPDSFEALSGDIHDGNQKYDFGTFYASKVFFDPVKQRNILFGWVNYACPNTDWTGIQTFPRSVTLDPADPTRIVSNPIEEIEELYEQNVGFSGIAVKQGTPYAVPQGKGKQLDIEMSFKPDWTASSSFGARVLADVAGTKGLVVTLETVAGSSRATLDGQSFLIAPGEEVLTLRLLVDHSVVEAIAQGGRAVATRPHCPGSPSEDGVQIFNNGPSDLTVTSMKVRRVATANFIPSAAKEHQFATVV